MEGGKIIQSVYAPLNIWKLMRGGSNLASADLYDA
jgi:hypothetical protein